MSKLASKKSAFVGDSGILQQQIEYTLVIT